MYTIKAFKVSDSPAIISQMPAKREWMDQTYDKHAYNCFPVTLTNTLGWSISFPEDITFIWDGISDSSSHHVKVLDGEKFVSTGRANATISFNTGIRLKTEDNVSLLIMPPPNLFKKEAQCFTTLISTSFFPGEIPIAWRITQPMVPITIKANEPVCTILPISLSEIQNSEINFFPISQMPTSSFNNDELGEQNKRNEIIKNGKWTNFYRDAVDWQGNKIGSHETKSIKLFVKDATS
jgi:hypothetical protein